MESELVEIPRERQTTPALYIAIYGVSPKMAYTPKVKTCPNCGGRMVSEYIGRDEYYLCRSGIHAERVTTEGAAK